MRVRRKAKDVDTAKAQMLTEVRTTNYRRLCIPVDWLTRLFIVFCWSRVRAPPRP